MIPVDWYHPRFLTSATRDNIFEQLRKPLASSQTPKQTYNSIFRTTDFDPIACPVLDFLVQFFGQSYCTGRGGLIIDTFDNSSSRRQVQEQCRALQLPCLHVGLFADYGEVIWDERYCVPQDVEGDVCDYPLARNLILLVVGVMSELLLRFVLSEVRQDVSVTLRDFSIRPMES